MGFINIRNAVFTYILFRITISIKESAVLSRKWKQILPIFQTSISYILNNLPDNFVDFEHFPLLMNYE